LANLILILREAPAMKGAVGYDEFNARVVIRKRPPWGEEAPDTPWVDHHESLLRVWFQTEAKINPSLGDVGRAVQAAARHYPFHPVRDYFNALVWDGTPRLDQWLVTYFHAEDSAYIRAIGPRYLISAVARIYEPGCQVDHLLVFEGPQGKQKSQALRMLAIKDAWFADRLSHLASKDAAQELVGVLIVEIAETDALVRASSSTAKSFLTRREDRFRPPYGKHLISLKRQCVFAATINPPVGGYLNDPPARGDSGPSPAAARSTARPLNATAISFGRRPCIASKPRSLGGWKQRNSKRSPPSSREHASRPTPWQAPIVEWLGHRTDVNVARTCPRIPARRVRAQEVPAVGCESCGENSDPSGI
jgi:hypothetical protein